LEKRELKKKKQDSLEVIDFVEELQKRKKKKRGAEGEYERMRDLTCM